MDKTIWIIANWKSNKNLSEALDWLSLVGSKVPKNKHLKVVVCPSFNTLSEIKKAIQVGNFPLMVGSQDLSPFGLGAYTGEEPAQLLKQFIELAILGHSERRSNFGETDQIVAEKVIQAISQNIIPLVCVQSQDTLVPKGCKLVAYEPVFAIGSGNPDTPENAEEVAKNIKEKNGDDLVVLYGGSVNDQNISSFVQKDNINGVLVGTASLDPDQFIKMIDAVS